MKVIKTTAKELYHFNKKLSVLHFFGGLDYTRCFEAPLSINNLQARTTDLILDIGSGSYNPIPLYFAHKGCTVYATDISDEVFKNVRFAKNAGLKNLVGSKFIVEKQDATHLTYPSNYFDRVLAISMIEHILGNGDTEAMEEIYRVLKPGGRAVVTLPYSKIFHENERSFNVNYFERRYDNGSIQDRIIKASKLKVEKIEFIGERLKFSKVWYRIPKYFRFGVLSIFFSNIFHRLFKSEQEIKRYADCGVVILTFLKTMKG